MDGTQKDGENLGKGGRRLKKEFDCFLLDEREKNSSEQWRDGEWVDWENNFF